MRAVVHARFGLPLRADHIPDLLRGLLFSDLFTNMIERTATLQEAEESYRNFYNLVEDILSVKEDEVRARQLVEKA